jgi:hypothetical protein
VYQGQKVHLFRPRLSFLAEAQPRLDNRRGQKALFGRGAQIFFFGDRTTTYLQYNYLFTQFMVTGQLLQLSSAISGGALDIFSSLSLLLSIMYMNVHFLVANKHHK